MKKKINTSLYEDKHPKTEKKKINTSLYEDKHPKTSTKGTGFKDKQKALDTLEIIKNRGYNISETSSNNYV